MKIEGVDDTEAATYVYRLAGIYPCPNPQVVFAADLADSSGHSFYLGKKVAFVYKGQKEISMLKPTVSAFPAWLMLLLTTVVE